MRILIVDDDIFAAELASLYLEMSGYEVLLAESAISALASLNNENNIDLVISDLHMPEISGLELLDMLRAQGWDKPFILLSANEMTDTPVVPSRWIKKDEHLADNLVTAAQDLLAAHAMAK
jgi:two-component system, OmpR family, response regulator CpxR